MKEGYLTNTELKKIDKIELSPRLDRARDMFYLFMLQWTGFY